MKKIKASQQQTRLKLGRETVRVLTDDELRRAGGGYISSECSDYWWTCSGGPTQHRR